LAGEAEQRGLVAESAEEMDADRKAFAESIATGTTCRYDPAEPVAWRT
jgi:hypothetical protein